jgi:guanylate kinase
VLQKLNASIDVILDIDWQGAKQVREKMPNCVSIFLLPPSKAALRERLEKRNRDPAEVIEKRLRIASDEITHCHEFDYIVVNDKFSQALRDIKTIMHASHLKQEMQAQKYAKLIKDLTKIK